MDEKSDYSNKRRLWFCIRIGKIKHRPNSLQDWTPGNALSVKNRSSELLLSCPSLAASNSLHYSWHYTDQTIISFPWSWLRTAGHLATPSHRSYQLLYDGNLNVRVLVELVGAQYPHWNGTNYYCNDQVHHIALCYVPSNDRLAFVDSLIDL